MVKILILFVFSLFPLNVFSFVTVNNATHTFLLSPQTDELVVIDRLSDEEKHLKTASRPVGLILTDTHAVVTCCLSDLVSFYDLNTYKRRDVHVGALPKEVVLSPTHAFIANTSDDKITIINLKTYDFKNVVVGKHPVKIVLTDTHAYVAICSPFDTNLVSHVRKVSLTTFAVDGQIEVCNGPVDMALFEDKLYVVSDEDAVLGVIDTKTNHYIKGIELDEGPNRIQLYERSAVISHERDVVTLLDLDTNEKLTFNVKNRPIYSYIYDQYLLVRSFVDDERGWVTLINLETKTANQVQVQSMPSSLTVSEGYVVVLNSQSQSVSIIDLKTSQVVREVSVHKDVTHVGVSDTHLYIDGKRFMPLFPTEELYHHFRKKRNLSAYLSPLHLDELGLVKSWDLSKLGVREDVKTLETLPRDTCLGTIIEYLDLKSIVALALTSKNLALRVGHDTSHDAILRPFLEYYWRGDMKKAAGLLRLIGSIGGTLKDRFKVRAVSSN